MYLKLFVVMALITSFNIYAQSDEVSSLSTEADQAISSSRQKRLETNIATKNLKSIEIILRSTAQNIPAETGTIMVYGLTALSNAKALLTFLNYSYEALIKKRQIAKSYIDECIVGSQISLCERQNIDLIMAIEGAILRELQKLTIARNNYSSAARNLEKTIAEFDL